MALSDAKKLCFSKKISMRSFTYNDKGKRANKGSNKIRRNYDSYIKLRLWQDKLPMIEYYIKKVLQTDSMSLEWEKNKKIVSNDDDKLSIYGVYPIKNE